MWQSFYSSGLSVLALLAISVLPLLAAGTRRADPVKALLALAGLLAVAMGAGVWPACRAADAAGRYPFPCGQGAILVPFIMLGCMLAFGAASFCAWLLIKRFRSNPP